MIKLIAFDLDGVLIDACEIHYRALNKALKEVCNYDIPRIDHVEIYNGLPTKEKLSILTNKALIKLKDHVEIFRLKQEYTYELTKESVKTDWQKIALMQRLYERNIKIACVSNAIRKTCYLLLEQLGVLEYVPLVVSNEDVVFNKPHPCPYIHVMRMLSVSPTDTLIVEDSPKGVESARNSGANVLVVKDSTEVTPTNVLCAINRAGLDLPICFNVNNLSD